MELPNKPKTTATESETAEDRGITEAAAALQGSPLFRSLDPTRAAELSAECWFENFVKGQPILSELAQSKNVYIVISGTVSIETQAVESRQAIISLCEPGKLIGVSNLFDPSQVNLLVKSLSKSKLLAIPNTLLLELIHQDSAFAFRACQSVVNDLAACREALADFALLDVTARTAKRILEFSAGADTFSLPITQEELAMLVGASRERVNKSLNSLVSLGWLDQAERTYTIRNRQQLMLRTEF